MANQEYTFSEAVIVISDILRINNETVLWCKTLRGEFDSSIRDHLNYAIPHEIAYTMIEHKGI